jgi:hypothetical protein
MSNVVTLDSLRESTIRKFEPVKIGLKDGSEVELKSMLRLGKKSRDAVFETITDMQSITGDSDSEEMSSEESDLLIESISKIFNLIASSPAKLLKELDDPDALIKVTLMTEVLNVWIGGAQLGEASNSPS